MPGYSSRITNQGRFQYTGQIWLPELGMSYYKARMYAPSLGRFMQTDPIGYADGMNWYAYVGNDPVNNVDPSGLYCKMPQADATPQKECEKRGGIWIPDIVVTARDSEIVVNGARIGSVINNGTAINVSMLEPGSYFIFQDGNLIAALTVLPNEEKSYEFQFITPGLGTLCQATIVDGAIGGLVGKENLAATAIGSGVATAANAEKIATAALPLGRFLNFFRSSIPGALLAARVQSAAGGALAIADQPVCNPFN